MYQQGGAYPYYPQPQPAGQQPPPVGGYPYYPPPPGQFPQYGGYPPPVPQGPPLPQQGWGGGYPPQQQLAYPVAYAQGPPLQQQEEDSGQHHHHGKALITTGVGILAGALATAGLGQIGHDVETIAATVQQAGHSAGIGQSLNVQQIEAGLREALNVAISNAVALTGRLDGFFAHKAIKILMPQEWRACIGLLKQIGFKKQIKEFVLSMNRAAEAAAPLARAIFVEAITHLRFDDVMRIFRGGDTAATDYLRYSTSRNLIAVFKPKVVEVMQQFQVTELYHRIESGYQKLPVRPFGNIAINIEEYVTGKAVEGLLWVMAQAERDIRRNPAARVTDLLKIVFGSLNY